MKIDLHLSINEFKNIFNREKLYSTMSCNYAEGLSEYEHKGVLGRKEKFDSEEEIVRKCNILTEWIKQSEHTVIHTGAGISTAAGIPDFRGPNGVWTLEKKGLKPTINISFDDAVPTKTHMAITKLVAEGNVQYVVSQNIDGLHLKSGLSRNNLAELHGNMYIEQCSLCTRQFVRNTATTSVGQKCLNIPCKATRINGRGCRGKLHDTILDWEADLPEADLALSDFHSRIADLSICLGTTLQIVPSGNLPTYTKKNNGRLVIVNLQQTKHDKKADLIINAYIDQVFELLMKNLNFPIPEYSLKLDPTKCSDSVIEWTIQTDITKLRHPKLVKKRKIKNEEVKVEKLEKIDFVIKSESGVKEEDIENTEELVI